MNKKYIVTLSNVEIELLLAIVNKGTNAQKIRRANILLGANQSPDGKKMRDEQVANSYNVSTRTVARTRQRFVEEGIDVTLNGKCKGTPRPRKIDGDIEAKIIALTRMSNEEGIANWTYQSIANQMVEKGYIDSISYESVRQVLKKMQ